MTDYETVNILSGAYVNIFFIKKGPVRYRTVPYHKTLKELLLEELKKTHSSTVKKYHV